MGQHQGLCKEKISRVRSPVPAVAMREAMLLFMKDKFETEEIIRLLKEENEGLRLEMSSASLREVGGRAGGGGLLLPSAGSRNINPPTGILPRHNELVPTSMVGETKFKLAKIAKEEEEDEDDDAEDEDMAGPTSRRKKSSRKRKAPASSAGRRGGKAKSFRKRWKAEADDNEDEDEEEEEEEEIIESATTMTTTTTTTTIPTTTHHNSIKKEKEAGGSFCLATWKDYWVCIEASYLPTLRADINNTTTTSTSPPTTSTKGAPKKDPVLLISNSNKSKKGTPPSSPPHAQGNYRAMTLEELQEIWPSDVTIMSIPSTSSR